MMKCISEWLWYPISSLRVVCVLCMRCLTTSFYTSFAMTVEGERMDKLTCHRAIGSVRVIVRSVHVCAIGVGNASLCEVGLAVWFNGALTVNMYCVGSFVSTCEVSFPQSPVRFLSSSSSSIIIFVIAIIVLIIAIFDVSIIFFIIVMVIIFDIIFFVAIIVFIIVTIWATVVSTIIIVCFINIFVGGILIIFSVIIFILIVNLLRSCLWSPSSAALFVSFSPWLFI